MDYQTAVLPTFYRLGRAVLGVPLLLLLLLLGWYHWRYRRVLSTARNLPKMLPTTKPLIGDLYYLFYGMSETIMMLLECSKSTAARGHKYACSWLGPHPIIWVFSPQDVHTVLTSSKTCEKSSDYSFVRQALGNGLLTAPSHVHKVTRRFIDPLFTTGSLNQLMPLFNRSGRHLVKDLSGHIGRGQFHVGRSMTPIVLSSISNVIFGPHVNIDGNSTTFFSLLKAMKCVSFILVNRLFKIWLWSDAVFEFLWSKDLLSMKRFWECFAKEQLAEGEESQMNAIKVARRKPSLNNNINYEEPMRVRRKSSVTVRYKVPQPRTLVQSYDHIMETHPQFNRQDLRNEMFTFLIAGSETTKVFISSCLLALAANQDIQERVYQEIVSLELAEDQEVISDDLHRLPYLDQVLKETLRRFNIIPFILRKVTEDLQLSGCLVPAGATVGVNIVGLHFNPTVFPNPEVFDPDRFSPENVTKMEKCSYLPFSGGSRNCIGKTYATMLVKTVLIHVLRQYRVSTNVDISTMRYNFGLLLYSVDGYQVALHKRGLSRKRSKTHPGSK